MKKILFPIIFLFTINVFGQWVYTANTYYLIPPTSGCNGLWVLNDTLGATSFCTYMNTPFGCTTFNHRNGDSLFLNLCSIPCDYIETCNGNFTFICTVHLTSEIKYVNENYIKIYTENQNIFIENPNLNIDYIELIDLNGKVIYSTKAYQNDLINLKINSDLKGIYFVNCRQKDKMTYVTKVQIN